MIHTQDPQQWTARLALPVHERIVALPDEVRDFVQRVNVASGLAAVPAAFDLAAQPGAALCADVATALRGLPASVLDAVAPLLLGVCLGRGIGSSGVTDIVADARDGRILGCIVLLDVDCFEAHTANSWATWKENLPFVIGADFSLDVTIANPAQDTRAHAMQFLLLHELAHVITAACDFLPRWWEPLTASAQTYSYLDLSWRINAQGRFSPAAGKDFELRGMVDFYGANKLRNDALVTAYTGLEGSDFPSLYGATNPYDDFAECFASYVHSEMMGRPYVLRIDFDGVPQATMDNFWDSPRSNAKRAFMQALFGEAAVPQAANEADAMYADHVGAEAIAA